MLNQSISQSDNKPNSVMQQQGVNEENNAGMCVDNNTLDANTEALKQKKPVFRFNLSDEMVDALLDFSKTHQFDDRHSYTDAWNEWKNDPHISKMLADEIERLQGMDYKGSAESIENKIFKSGRYYFRNKSFVKVPPKPRGKYISVSKELICAMDEHIARGINNNDNNNNNDGQIQIPSPADLFGEFCKRHVYILKTEIDRLVELELFSEDPLLIIAKIKKTYKNRVFQFLN
jgi:hypothetical protein